ncbi:MAG: hypothetical protein SFH39_12200 [Candidatus Magnetobacterium sp. LHC-1]|nr:hypothetical protein [Nitrospirota bacterium]
MSDGHKKAEVILGVAKDLLIAANITVPRSTTSGIAGNTVIRIPNTEAQDEFEAVFSYLASILSKQYDELVSIKQSSQK